MIYINRVAITILLALLSACSLKYESINPDEFNAKVISRDDIKSPADLMRLYYQFDKDGGEEAVKFHSAKSSDNIFVIKLIHKAIPDDSIAAKKIIMRAKKNNYGWVVLEIRESWKCWPGRGHVDWGAVRCG